MAISLVDASDQNLSTSVDVNVVLPYTTMLPTDVFVTFHGGKPYNCVSSFSAGGTALCTVTSGSVANGVDTGSTWVTTYAKTIGSYSQGQVLPMTTDITPNPQTNETWIWRGDSGALTYAAVALADTDETGTSVSATAASNPGFTTGDVVLVHVLVNSDATTHSSQTVTVPGCTLGTFTWRSRPTSVGADLNRLTGYATVVSGTATGAPSYTATSSTSGGSAFAGAIVRLRETSSLTVASVTMPRTRALSATAASTSGAATVTMVRTRTLTAAGAGPVGETPANPIPVTATGAKSVLTTGWARDSGETSLGATGVGVFWFKVTAPARTTIHVTNTAASSLEMFAYTVADPGQPITTSNLSFVSSGDDILTMVSVPLYVMVDVQSNAGTVPFSFTFTTAPVGSISFSVASDTGVSATEAKVGVTPASVSATVSATTSVTSFNVLLDGEIIESDLPLAADGTWSGFINIPAVDAGGYLLNLFGNGAGVYSNDITLTVERTPVVVGGLPDDAPARIPGTAVGRWSFWDPATNASYAFPMNPSTASSTNSPRNHSVESTTRPTSFVVYEGSLQAKSYTFGGVLLDQEMYQNLAAWSKLNRRIYLVDHNMVAWQVVPQHFDVHPRTNRLNPWIQDYEFTVLLLKGPSDAEVF